MNLEFALVNWINENQICNPNGIEIILVAGFASRFQIYPLKPIRTVAFCFFVSNCLGTKKRRSGGRTKAKFPPAKSDVARVEVTVRRLKKDGRNFAVFSFHRLFFDTRPTRSFHTKPSLLVPTFSRRGAGANSRTSVLKLNFYE